MPRLHSSRRIPRVEELLAILETCEWFTRVAATAAAVRPPEWWISAGVIRDIVWGERFGRGFDPHSVKDVDLGFFDPHDVTPERDAAIEHQLRAHDRSVPWDAKNQAAVHLWYPRRFGVAVAPFTSAGDAVATFPEYASCVAVRRTTAARWEVAAPHGLDDLLDGVWRRNPLRVTESEYQARLGRKQPERRWRGVRVV